METEKRTASNFNKIHLLGYGTLKITQGKLESLEITSNEKNLPFIESEVEDKTLKLKVKSSVFFGFRRLPKGPITYTVNAKNISEINISGSAEVIGTKIDTEKLRLDISGSSSFKMSGKADIQEIISSGFGSVDCTDLEGKSGSVIASGSGKFKVNISDSLRIKVSGSSDVFYKGSPKIDQHVSGSGRISRL